MADEVPARRGGDVQRHLIEPRGEEVSRRVIRRTIAGQILRRQRACLEDPVVDVLIGERQIVVAGAYPELREGLVESRSGGLPPAVFLRRRAGEVEIDRASLPRAPPPVLVEPCASR